MTKHLFIFLLFMLCGMPVLQAGNAQCVAFAPPKVEVSAFAVTHNGNSGSKSQSKAYFNLREPHRATPTLQTRGVLSTPIQVLQSDIVAFMQTGKFQRERAFNSVSIMMDIGTADAVNAQSWTIPSNILSLPNNLLIHYFIDPTTIPVGGRVANETHATRTTVINSDNQPVIRYGHYQLIDGDELDELGETFDELGIFTDYGEARNIYVDAPLDLGDNFTNDLTIHDDEDALPKKEAINAVLVDAFGSITTPYGIFECLRFSITQTRKTFTTSTTIPSATETRYYVGWIAKNGFLFFAKKTSAAAAGMVSLDGLVMADVNDVSTLPVELLSFDAQTNGKTVDLTWTTASESNNAGFDIERSADGKTFEKIGFVKGSGTTSEKHSYMFTDNTPLSKTAYYRLQQVDFDGSKVSSNVISIAPKDEVKGVKVYPNPSENGLIFIEIADGRDAMHRVSTGITITDAVGQTVFQQQTQSDNLLKVDVSAWASGVYFVKSGNNVVKFVKN